MNIYSFPARELPPISWKLKSRIAQESKGKIPLENYMQAEEMPIAIAKQNFCAEPDAN
jgi:hypothetical protein